IPQVRSVYVKNSPLRLVSLCGASASYERELVRQLRSDKFTISDLVVVDLQQKSLAAIPQGEAVSVLADISKLPLRSPEATADQGERSGQLLLVSRIMEHYLPDGVLEDTIREVGRVL